MSVNQSAESIRARKGPFRADQVGSLLRPDYLLAARAQYANKEIDADALRLTEDRAIREAVALQQSVGMRAVTDGEFRRAYFHLDFLAHLEGVSTEYPRIERGPDGRETLTPPVFRVTGKLANPKGVQVEDFIFLNEAITATGDQNLVAKVAIPSPTMLHFRGGRAGISEIAYPVLDPDFYDDVAAVYGKELQALYQAGCRYVQLDDTNLAYLCDAKMREAARQRGDDPDQLTRRYAELLNKVAAYKPADMTLGIHLCRGNFKSRFAAEGAYDPVAEALLGGTDIDAYFLEYDDERSGDFAPLRYLAKGKYAVLGLVTSKTGEMESKDSLKRRIEDAARFAPLEQLCLSPQCGFASTEHGNDITVEKQAAKLRLVVETAQEVWGEN
jgi:5-methyltetrahydropteroyltriglutamate--homocysteine methyltransferase